MITELKVVDVFWGDFFPSVPLVGHRSPCSQNVGNSGEHFDQGFPNLGHYTTGKLKQRGCLSGGVVGEVRVGCCGWRYVAN